MPIPVLAFPCGSRSTIKTCSPIAASAVARLMAVVVLPTPPFWFAIVIMRLFWVMQHLTPLSSLWLEPRYLENNGIGLDSTRMFYQIEYPAATRILDFLPIIQAFMEKCPCLPVDHPRPRTKR